MSKPTIETFDYSKSYTLDSLGKLFKCSWVDLPVKSGGIIEESQKMEVLNDRYIGKVLDFNFDSGTFQGYGGGMSTGATFFKIVPNELILNIEGI